MLTILQEVFPAVKAAEMAVKFRPLWWEGWQTLGRAQLNLGEVDLVSVAAPYGWNQNICTTPRGWQWKLLQTAERETNSILCCNQSQMVDFFFFFLTFKLACLDSNTIHLLIYLLLLRKSK